jgi:superfamily II DNA helicase RecQ
MALLTQFASFFVSPFGEASVCDELNLFLRSHRVINVEKRLVDGERGTGWLFLIEYGEALKGAVSASPKVDYKELLNEKEYALYNALRDLRKTLGEQQGVAVYTIFTNEQLVAMVKKHPHTKKDIAAIPGVGESRLNSYAESFIKFFNTLEVPNVETIR